MSHSATSHRPLSEDLYKGSVVSYVSNMLRVRRIQIEVHVVETIGNDQIKEESMNRKDLCRVSKNRIRADFEIRQITD